MDAVDAVLEADGFCTESAADVLAVDAADACAEDLPSISASFACTKGNLFAMRRLI